MNDLIDRQAAIDAINHICPVDTEYDCTLLDRVDVRYVLSDLPSAERKTGKWIDAVLPNDSGGLQVQVCDQCNTFFPLAYTGGGHNFCPNCGADMRGGKNDKR